MSAVDRINSTEGSPVAALRSSGLEREKAGAFKKPGSVLMLAHRYNSISGNKGISAYNPIVSKCVVYHPHTFYGNNLLPVQKGYKK